MGAKNENRGPVVNKFGRQLAFEKTHWAHRLSHGGTLRRARKGRRARPLACRESIHLVFKANSSALKHRSLRSAAGFRLVNRIIERYAKMFFVKVEQLSIQNDHIHLLIRTSKRSFYHHFFRVVAGQIAQRFEKEGLLVEIESWPSIAIQRGRSAGVTDTPAAPITVWKYRPFTRVVRGYRAYRRVQDYVQLNEQEIRGVIPYRKTRLKGLSASEWELLWS